MDLFNRIAIERHRLAASHNYSIDLGTGVRGRILDELRADTGIIAERVIEEKPSADQGGARDCRASDCGCS